MNKVLFSIDLDEWYHARWCTGSNLSLWPSTEDFFREYYGQDHPVGELTEPVHYILDVLAHYRVKGTFFVLGEVAEYYGGLLREIVRQGHEIACHALRHRDMHHLSKKAFIAEVSEAKSIIEDVTGRIVRGFRVPNAVLPSYLVEALEEIGFIFDSSMFPSRKFQGKYGYTHAPLHPYVPSRHDIELPGESRIVELPVAVFPGIRLVAGSGIFTRVFGYWWTKAALTRLLRTGDTVYYFHPYELMPAPKLDKLSFSQRIFIRNTGNTMRRYFNQLMQDFEGRFATFDQLNIVQTLKERGMNTQ
jgi:polysaccharide deacetylase family protein (PEP-CTERM system associated)